MTINGRPLGRIVAGRNGGRVFILWRNGLHNTPVHDAFRRRFQIRSSIWFHIVPCGVCGISAHASVAGLGVLGPFGPRTGNSSGTLPGSSSGRGGAPGSRTGVGTSGRGFPGGTPGGGSFGVPGVAGGTSGGSIGIYNEALRLPPSRELSLAMRPSSASGATTMPTPLGSIPEPDYPGV